MASSMPLCRHAMLLELSKTSRKISTQNIKKGGKNHQIEKDEPMDKLEED